MLDTRSHLLHSLAVGLESLEPQLRIFVLSPQHRYTQGQYCVSQRRFDIVQCLKFTRPSSSRELARLLREMPSLKEKLGPVETQVLFLSSRAGQRIVEQNILARVARV